MAVRLCVRLYKVCYQKDKNLTAGYGYYSYFKDLLSITKIKMLPHSITVDTYNNKQCYFSGMFFVIFGLAVLKFVECIISSHSLRHFCSCTLSES